ncbi:DegT/DnrJ/EryC1/StrS family aminotransferase, partial [Streptomyces sp. H27-D2]|uniref:DegT/DnrJ/EryC1/StrS family aminotransferase n=1 Tax=Streptomyces sp. H27-D2 TaxID=3046304 RepID=UPI002DBAC438
MLGLFDEPIPAAPPVIGEEEIDAAVRVLRGSGGGSGGVQAAESAAFEEEFAELVSGRYCVAVDSGVSALRLTLTALGIGAGDEVVVPSFAFAATADAVRLAGAEPVFADIRPDSFCLDPDAAAAAIGPRTAALLPVHLYGHPAAMDRLLPLAARHGLAVVEDACQAHGASLHGRPVGSFGTAGCFSFHPARTTHSLAGGMVSTADPELARTLRRLRGGGTAGPASPAGPAVTAGGRAYEGLGADLRMTAVAAAVGREQLKKLPGWTARRRANGAGSR